MKRAVVVLGGGVRDDGSLSLTVQNRVRRACAVFDMKNCNLFIFSGKCGYALEAKPVTEAQAMATFAQEYGVDEHQIVLEENSQDTISNAFFTRKICEEQNIDVLHVVTSDYHMTRASYIFSKIFPTTINLHFTVSPSGIPKSGYDKVLRVELEHLKLCKLTLGMLSDNELAFIENHLSQHPEYGKIFQEIVKYCEKLV